MKVKVILTGKSVIDLEEKIEGEIKNLGNIELKHVVDSGMRIILFYEEKAWQENGNNVINKESKENKGSKDAASTTNNTTRSRVSKKSDANKQPTNRKKS